MNKEKHSGRTKIFDHSAARNQEQAERMQELEKAGICPFCQEHLGKNQRNEIEYQNLHWAITKNDYPYEGTTQHYLIILLRHAESFEELSAAESASFFGACKWVTRTKKLVGETLIMRSGDTQYTGASILHLHAHIVVGEMRDENANQESFKIKVGFKKKTPQQ